MLIWTGFTYTKKEKVVDAGPIQISADKEKSVNWLCYLSAAGESKYISSCFNVF
jgi:hypothetical protein